MKILLSHTPALHFQLPPPPHPQTCSTLGLILPSSSQFNCIIFVKLIFSIYYIYIDNVVFFSISFLLEYFLSFWKSLVCFPRLYTLVYLPVPGWAQYFNGGSLSIAFLLRELVALQILTSLIYMP